jgi:PAS domain S-box-containing protein
VSALLIQTALIAALLLQRARRRRTEATLRENQQRYALATSAGAVGVWDWKLDTKEIYVDPQLKLALGYQDEEIPNHLDDWGQRVHPDDRQPVMERAQACIEGRTNVYEVEHRMLHKDGSLRWFLARGTVIRGPDGSAYRLVGTDTDITELKRAQTEIQEHEAELRVSNAEIQYLAGRLIAAQEAERTRIARDLHDDVSQQVAGLSIALSSFKRRVAALQAEDDVQEQVASLQQRTIALADNIRQLSHELHPGVLQHAGLVAALTAHCAEFQREQSLQVTFGAEDEFGSIGPGAALCLYRVAQEALRNTATHAEAGRAEVRLVRRGNSAELTIADDGKGFDITRGRNGNGLGLLSINERVRLARGTVSIVTELNKGTRVQIRIPIDSHTAADTIGTYERRRTPA